MTSPSYLLPKTELSQRNKPSSTLYTTHILSVCFHVIDLETPELLVNLYLPITKTPVTIQLDWGLHYANM